MGRFRFFKRDIWEFCHAWKSGFRLVYTVVVTLCTVGENEGEKVSVILKKGPKIKAPQREGTRLYMREQS